MPTKTYDNLPPEKREKIYEAALKEFSTNSFKTSSIANIIKEAGIPRGSFYQYFRDKKDIYMYIAHELAKAKFGYFAPIIENKKDYTIFEFLMALTEAGVEFSQSCPQLQQYGIQFNRDDVFKDELHGAYVNQVMELYLSVLREDAKKGLLRHDLNLKMVAKMLYTLQTGLLEEEFIKGDQIQMDELLKRMREMLEVFMNGILENNSKK